MFRSRASEGPRGDTPIPTSLEDLLAHHGLFMGYQSSMLPTLPPRPAETITIRDPGREDSEAMPTFSIIPYIRKTEVPLNIQRKTLENYMDR